MVGPTYNELDFGVSKAWKLTERAGLQFRADMFNILNHPNFNLPANQLYTNQFVGSVKLEPAQWTEVEQRVKKELPSMRG